jgi:predicted neutral ceramidase superfamily lipid hydrolase
MAEIKFSEESYKRFVNDAFENVIGKDFEYVVQAVKEKLEREELPETNDSFVRVPFKIGTTVYCLHDSGPLRGSIIEQTVNGYSESKWNGSINNGKDYRFIICHNSYNEPHAWQLKNVFSSREEAEAKKRQEIHNES